MSLLPAIERSLPLMIVVACVWTLPRVSAATPPPTEEEAKRLRAAAAITECVHCAGRGDPQSQAYQTCAYLSPYGFERGARYLDGARYGHFFCRPRSPEAKPLPDDLRTKAENGEDDPAAEAAKVPGSRAACAQTVHGSGDGSALCPVTFVALAVVARRRSRRPSSAPLPGRQDGWPARHPQKSDVS